MCNAETKIAKLEAEKSVAKIRDYLQQRLAARDRALLSYILEKSPEVTNAKS